MPLDIHIVLHTHWDREWYRPLGRFRQRLVALIDELLVEPPREFEAFLLDGQAILLEDYLGVRPECRESVAALLRDGRFEAGPWYVLPDELIPSGEALVRNLLAGRSVLKGLGAESPPVLYCPDSFGHPAALPEIASGFGLPVIIAWRGFGGSRWPHGDTFAWRAPSGVTATLFHLPRSGYEFGANLPTTADGARGRWGAIRAELAPRTTTGVVLIQNGADHHARQIRYREAFDALVEAALPDVARASSLRAFAAALRERTTRSARPLVEGELRDSYGYSWTIQGTLASRADQKRRNALTERALVHDAEPWAAIARARGGASRRALTAAAWKTLLLAHPHDTLCGCSIDEVAKAMAVRLASARAQADGIRDDAIGDIVGHDPATARLAEARWQPVMLVRNRAPRSRGGVAVVEFRHWVADVPVGPGSGSVLDAAPLNAMATELTLEGAAAVQALESKPAFDLIESPRHYPANDLVTITRAVAWVQPVTAYGVAALRLVVDRTPKAEVPHPVRASRRALENGIVRAAVDRDGSVVIEDVATKTRIDSLIRFEDLIDHGDLYTPSLRGEAASATFVGARVVHRGPLRGEIEARWNLVASPGLPTHGVSSRVRVRIGIDANAPFVRVLVEGENHRPDHRLRMGFRTQLRDPSVWADAAFGVVAREQLVVSAEDQTMEMVLPTAPLHRYVALFTPPAGATLFSDGLGEYEARTDGEILVTLVRAVGELSRSDLPERPGHAAWPHATPDAQSIRPFRATFALLLHGGRSPEVVQLIEDTAADVLLPLVGSTLRSALSIPEPQGGIELNGLGLAFSAFKESEDGAWVVARCVNLLEREVEGRWSFAWPLTEAWQARLDETPAERLATDGGRVTFRAGARAVVTILAR